MNPGLHFLERRLIELIRNDYVPLLELPKKTYLGRKFLLTLNEITHGTSTACLSY